MDINTLKNKQIIEKNGERLIDLTQSTLKFVNEVSTIGLHTIPKTMEMRPDLISLSVYNNQSFWDYILKYNGISNPFSVESDDIILIPELSMMSANIKNFNVYPFLNSTPNKKYDIRSQFLTTDRKNVKDINKLKYEKKLKEFENISKEKSKNPPKEILPPNFAGFDDKQVKVKGGHLIFGPDISKNNDVCETSIPKAEFINRLIKNRLKK